MKIRLTAGALVAAFIFTIMLAAAPREHEAVHQVNGHHECAVTLFAAGKCHHTGPVELRVQSVLLAGADVHGPAVPRIILAHFEAFVLEHAPPALS